MYTKIKTEDEITAMREGGQMLAKVLQVLKQHIKAGMSTQDLADIARAEIKKFGAEPAFLGQYDFKDVICISVNDEVVHGVPNKKRILHDGDIVGLDFGVRLYMELARQQLEQHKSVLVLVPEISLTPQLAQEFTKVFKQRVIILHSNLTEASRRNLWLEILENASPLIVIGARSALFSPLRNIGLVVVDEVHETAYKQEQAPYYVASRVAAKLASLHGAKLILGSATPSVTDYNFLQAKKAEIIRMTEVAVNNKSVQTSVEVIDLRNRDLLTRQPHLSDTLLNAIRASLDNKEQSLVFLNRRGTARLILCQSCGWQALCPKCDLPLTYHGDNHTMRCHTCGFSQTTVSSCPVCESAEIVFKSIGTKTIVDELQSAFPEARIARFDTDNKKTERFDQQYESVKKGNIDILVGTQMLVKGLDLPLLSVVGVVMADTSLYFPDYSASERTFQLITQVLGRIGRGHRSGTAIIQTYNPTNPIFTAAVQKDWETFYETELEERKLYQFPPFVHVLKLHCQRASQKSAQSAAQKLADELRRHPLKIQIIGPAPSFYEKIHGKYTWQLIIKAKDRRELLAVIKLLPTNWGYDIDPTNLL